MVGSQTGDAQRRTPAISVRHRSRVTGHPVLRWCDAGGDVLGIQTHRHRDRSPSRDACVAEAVWSSKKSISSIPVRTGGSPDAVTSNFDTIPVHVVGSPGGPWHCLPHGHRMWTSREHGVRMRMVDGLSTRSSSDRGPVPRSPHRYLRFARR